MGIDNITLSAAKNYVDETLVGAGGLKGEDGFSPVVAVKESSDTVYKLEITTAAAKFETPNLMAGVTVEDTLSADSVNPVQNKAIVAALANKANTVDIPTSLPANGGNADTVDGMHADDFATSVNPTITGSIKIVRPSSTSTIQSIFSISDTIRIRNLDSETSQTNNYADIIVTTSGVFTEKAINGVFQGRKELLTSTCVAGTSTIVDSNNFVFVNFGFTPSAVLYAVYDSKTDVDNNYRLAQEFNSTGFVAETRVAPVAGGTETFSYIAFR